MCSLIFLFPCIYFCFLTGDSKTVLSEYILRAVLKLLQKEVPENGRHLHQYFSFFWMYAGLGTVEVLVNGDRSKLYFKIEFDFTNTQITCDVSPKSLRP